MIIMKHLIIKNLHTMHLNTMKCLHIMRIHIMKSLHTKHLHTMKFLLIIKFQSITRLLQCIHLKFTTRLYKQHQSIMLIPFTIKFQYTILTQFMQLQSMFRLHMHHHITQFYHLHTQSTQRNH